MKSTELSKQDQTMIQDGSTKSKKQSKGILKMRIEPSEKQTIEDLHDFYELIWSKAERLGFVVTKGEQKWTQ